MVRSAKSGMVKEERRREGGTQKKRWDGRRGEGHDKSRRTARLGDITSLLKCLSRSPGWKRYHFKKGEKADRQTDKKEQEGKIVGGWAHWEIWIYIYVASVPPDPWPDLRMTEHACYQLLSLKVHRKEIEAWRGKKEKRKRKGKELCSYLGSCVKAWKPAFEATNRRIAWKWLSSSALRAGNSASWDRSARMALLMSFSLFSEKRPWGERPEAGVNRARANGRTRVMRFWTHLRLVLLHAKLHCRICWHWIWTRHLQSCHLRGEREGVQRLQVILKSGKYRGCKHTRGLLMQNSDSLGGAARNLRCKLSTSSSTGMLRRPHLCPRCVGAIFTQTSLLPDARTPSRRLARRESLHKRTAKYNSSKSASSENSYGKKTECKYITRANGQMTQRVIKVLKNVPRVGLKPCKPPPSHSHLNECRKWDMHVPFCGGKPSDLTSNELHSKHLRVFCVTDESKYLQGDEQRVFTRTLVQNLDSKKCIHENNKHRKRKKNGGMNVRIFLTVCQAKCSPPQRVSGWQCCTMLGLFPQGMFLSEPICALQAPEEKHNTQIFFIQQ